MRTKEELIEMDRAITEIRRKEIKGKCMVIRWYLICKIIAVLFVAAMILYKEHS